MLVTVEDNGAVGIGECVADANPFYSAETTRTAWHIIAEFIAPIVLGRQFDHPREVFGALGPIRGHHMAKAAVEMAAWDLFARQQGQPLAAVLGGTRTSHRVRGVDRYPGFARRARRARPRRARRPAIGGSKSRSSRAGTWTRWPGCARLAAMSR